jgi:hypothetical protein
MSEEMEQDIVILTKLSAAMFAPMSLSILNAWEFHDLKWNYCNQHPRLPLPWRE